MQNNGNSRKHSDSGAPAKQSNGKPSSRSNVLPSFKFVRCDLSRDQKEALIHSISEGGTTEGQAFDLVSEGYKLSISRDTKNDCYIASLSDNREGSRTRGYVLSARGASINIALCALSFKHNIVLSEGWLEGVASEVERNEWGIG